MQANEEVIFTIIVVVVVLIFLAILFLVILTRHNQHRNSLLSENEQIKKEFEKTLLNTQLEIQEQTLSHVSQEIHDNIGQVLSIVRLQINTLSVDNLNQEVEYTDQLLEKAITDLRALSHNLNTNSIKEKGFIEAVKQVLSQFENTGKFKTSLEEEAQFEINDDQGIILFRIIQELLNNIVKHARASQIIIRIRRENDQFSISVIDNGCGFNTENILSKSGGGIGLQNISDRAKVIGAKISLFSQPQKGTTISITF